MAIITPIVPTASTNASALEKAEAAKQKGNDLFKKGSYAESIGHYSEAHLLVPSSAIYPLNRAQAYLNLSKFADAERDCSKSIALDSKTTKAWFRRGVARRGLGNWKGAKEDFAMVLKLDPKMSTSVKTELNKVKLDEEAEVLKKNKGKKVVPPLTKPNPPSTSTSLPPKLAPTPKSYPIPIKMVYPSPSPSSPVSTTTPTPSAPTSKPSLSPPPAPSSTPATNPDPTASIFPTKPKPKATPPTTFAALQSARNAKPALPLPASSSSTSAPTPTTTTTAVKKVVHPKPTSAHALHKTLLTIDQPEEAFEFLVSLPPSTLPSIIGSSLEPALFGLLLSILEAAGSGKEWEKREIGQALEGTQRFMLAKMMTERGEERWVGLGLGV
ncbi:hypothetical protein BDY24DRAFT_116160 [Mrakia frigida]|uniref:uncharacterized protein n=1 Tax=Mrakia frigida TaxID=29902 RepID=UPI003FCC23B4